MANFDPYHQWLSIPPQDQPPHHYRLLAVNLFEEDLGVIESAADRQMKHLRDFQSGKHADLSQKLLNEVSAARVTLLDPAKKAAYDDQLRSSLGLHPEQKRGRTPSASAPQPGIGIPGYAQERPLPKAKPLSVEQPLATAAGLPGATGGLPVGATGGLPTRAGSFEDPAVVAQPTPSRRGGSLPLIVMIGGAAALLLLLAVGGVAALWLMSNSPSEVAVNNPPPTGIITPPAGGTDADPPAVEQPTTNTNPPTTITKTSDPGTTSGGETKPPLSTEYPVPSTESPDSPSGETDPPAGEEPADTGETSPPLTAADPPEDEPEIEAAPAKLPVPEKDARDKKRAEILAIFPTDKAKTFEEKGTLAADLIRTARETENDAPAQFALLNIAREQAAQAGQINLAFEAIDALDAIFEFDADAIRVSSLDQAAKAAIPLAAKREIVEIGMQMANDLSAADDFDRAVALSTRMATLARALRDAELTKTIAKQRKSLDALADDYKKSKDAFEKLKTAPDDPAANLVAGRYLTFVKQDWDAGLAHLAKGSDALLAAAAKADLAAPSAAADVEKLADAWWTAAEAQKDPTTKNLCHARAGNWYREIVDQLSGLAKVKVEKRIEDTGEIDSRAKRKEMQFLRTVAAKTYVGDAQSGLNADANTGVKVTRGQLVSFSVDGMWKYKFGNGPGVGPEGTLVAAIGEPGRPAIYEIVANARQFTFKVQQDGWLFLGINDRQRFDNSGELAVNVAVK